MKRFYLVRVDGDARNVYASAISVRDAEELANADAGSTLEYSIVYSTDAGAARLKTPTRWIALQRWSIS